MIMKYRCRGSCHNYTKYLIYVLNKTIQNDTFKYTTGCDGQNITGNVDAVDLRIMEKEVTASALIHTSSFLHVD